MNINDLNSLLQFDFVRPTKIKVQKDEHRVLPDNLKNDVFEKSQKTFEIQIKHTCPKSTATKNINVTINPLDKGTIYKKVLNNKTGKTEKVPMQVDIAKSQEKTGVSYYFLKIICLILMQHIIQNCLKIILNWGFSVIGFQYTTYKIMMKANIAESEN